MTAPPKGYRLAWDVTDVEVTHAPPPEPPPEPDDPPAEPDV